MLRVVFFLMGRGGGMAKVREELEKRHRGGRRIRREAWTKRRRDEGKQRRREADKNRRREDQT
jgi:hypothetical protein